MDGPSSRPRPGPAPATDETPHRRPSPHPRPADPAIGLGIDQIALGAPEPNTEPAYPAEPSQTGTTRSRSVLLRGGSWNAAAQLAPILVNLALTPYVIHGLGLARFGLYVLATSIADFLGTFDGGLYSAAQRYFAMFAGMRDDRSTGRLLTSLTAAVTVFGGALFAILYFAAGGLVELFRVPTALRGEGTFLLQILGLVLALQILRGVFAALLNANRRFAVTSIATVVQYAIYTVGIVATIQQGWGLRGVALTLLIQTLVIATALGVIAFRIASRGELGFLPRREVLGFLAYAGRAQVASFSDLINLQADSVIVGGFIGVRSVGLYSSGRNFASQLRSFPVNAISPAATVLGEIFGRDGLDGVTREFGRLQRIWVRGCAGWIAVAVGAAWFGVTRWLGSGFELAGTVAVVLLGGYLFRLCADMLSVYCQTVGHPELEARYGVAAVVVNLALTFALVVPFGVVGVVAATAVAQLAGSLYLLRLVRLRLRSDIASFLADIPWPWVLGTAAVTAALEFAARPLVTTGPLGLLECGVIAAPALIGYGVWMVGPQQALGYARQIGGRLRGAAR